MDANLVYIKTSAGEEALHHRSDTMSRHTRMVLILVDGKSSVADLILKTGNAQQTEDALFELEKAGLAEPALKQILRRAKERQDTREIHAQEIKPNSLNLGTPSEASFSAPLPDDDLPTLTVKVAAQLPLKNKEDWATRSVFEQPLPSAPDLSNFMGTVAQRSKIGPTKVPVRPLLDEQPDNSEDASASVSASTSLWGRVTQQASSPPEIKAPEKWLRAQEPKKTSAPLKIFVGLIIVVLVAILSILFFPYSIYLADVEAAISETSGKPAKVGSLQVNFSAQSILTLSDVRLGNGNDEIRIVSMSVQPDIASLFGHKKIIRHVLLSGIKLPLDTADQLNEVLHSVAKVREGYLIQSLRFEKTDIYFGQLPLTGMQGELNLEASAPTPALVVRSAEQNLTLTMQRVNQGIDFSVDGFAWSPPFNSTLRIASLNLKGRLKNKLLRFNTIDLRLFEGVVKGSAELRQSDLAEFTGDIAYERLNASSLGSALGLGTLLVGEVSGQLAFTSRAPKWEAIFSTMHAQGDFSIGRGSLLGLDFAESSRRFSDAPIIGGSTSFESLVGTMKLSPEKSEFSNLRLEAAKMQTSGSFFVDQNLRLQGLLSLQMQLSDSRTRSAEMTLGGAVKTPTLSVVR